MFLAAGFSSTSDIVFLFAASGIILYVASRAAADALTSLSDPSAGKLALAQWLPIAWAALLPTLAGHSEIGVGIAFASGVAALTMVLGILLCIASPVSSERANSQRGFPVEPPAGASASAEAAPRVIAPASWLRAPHAASWPFLLPGALLALMAGFTGTLTLLHAAMFLLMGGCVLAVWRGGRDPADAPSATTPPTSSGTAVAYQFILALGLGAAGAWMAYKAVMLADERTRVAATGLIAMAVISPLLVLPMLGTGAIAAHHGRLDRAIASIIGVALLNLFLLLPLIVIAHYVSQVAQAVHASAATTQPAAAAAAATTTTNATTPAAEMLIQLQPLPFPLAVWRVDTTILIVVGMMLVPVSLGRWPLRRVEGFVLTLLFFVYLVVSTTIVLKP
jgi:Ca2+/Na+ antiporter